MSLNIALLAFSATSTIVSGLCALNVITIPVKTEAETTDAFGVYYVEKYIPLEQTRPVVRQNPEHLFNLLYDPREPGCTQLTVERSSVGTPDKFTFSLSPDCYQKPFGSVVSLDYAGMSQDGARTMRYKCRNGTLQLAHHFSDFILVQLRVSFLFAEELLLMEDLSARAPPGSWMMLRRDTGNGTKKCACKKLEKFTRKYQIVYEQIYHDVKPKKRNEISIVWIGGSIAVPIFVVIVCIGLKWVVL